MQAKRCCGGCPGLRGLFSWPNCCVTLGCCRASLGLTFSTSFSGEAPGKFITAPGLLPRKVLARPQNPHLKNSTPAQPQRGGLCNQALCACVGGRGGAQGVALTAIPGAAIFSPIDEAASAAAAGIPETSMGARHGPCLPARLPGEARPELGQRRGRPRAAGAGGAAAAGTARWGASPGRGARRLGCRSVRRLQRNWWGVPRGARDPKPPGMVASEVRSCSPAGWCASWEGGGGEASHVRPAR